MLDFGLRPEDMETIEAVRVKAEWESSMAVEIPSSKKVAKNEDDKDLSTYKVYTDGSGIEGRIGASAVLYKNGVEKDLLRLYLGKADVHTVFEGEGVGGILALVLLGRLDALDGPVTIVVDSQPAIRATRAIASTPSHWLWDLWHAQAQSLAMKHPVTSITIRWAPGHVGIDGNERADELAKTAARDRMSSRLANLVDVPAALKGYLPWSKSAIRQDLMADMKARIAGKWAQSKRHARTMLYDPKITTGSYLVLADKHPRSLAVLLLQLHTGHIPLAKHLYRINKADSPICPCCRQGDETVQHYLLHCSAHRDARRELYRIAGPRMYNLAKLLGSPKLIPHLFRFVGRTGRFHAVHGDLPVAPDPYAPSRREFVNFLANFPYPVPFPRDADPLNPGPAGLPSP